MDSQKVRFTSRVSSDLVSKLDAYCLAHGYDRNDLVNQMLIDFIEKWGYKE